MNENATPAPGVDVKHEETPTQPAQVQPADPTQHPAGSGTPSDPGAAAATGAASAAAPADPLVTEPGQQPELPGVGVQPIYPGPRPAPEPEHREEATPPPSAEAQGQLISEIPHEELKPERDRDSVSEVAHPEGPHEVDVPVEKDEDAPRH